MSPSMKSRAFSSCRQASRLVSLLGLGVLSLALGAPPENQAGPKSLILSIVMETKDPVYFSHQAHQAYRLVEGCPSCHHQLTADGTSSEPAWRCSTCHSGQTGATARASFSSVLHRQCKDCHRKAMEHGKPRPPLGCRQGCHARSLTLDRIGSEETAVAFDHATHREVYANNQCARCHHAGEAGERPQGCYGCHLPRGDVKTIFHKQCIGCHLERASHRASAPGAQCTFCHVADARKPRQKKARRAP